MKALIGELVRVAVHVNGPQTVGMIGTFCAALPLRKDPKSRDKGRPLIGADIGEEGVRERRQQRK